MTLRLTALPCFAASMNRGIGRGVVKGADSVLPSRTQGTAPSANAVPPIAKLRRVSIIAIRIFMRIDRPIDSRDFTRTLYRFSTVAATATAVLGLLLGQAAA